jgi:hypothetical protein
MVARQFFWPNMTREIRQFCANCDRCGRSKIWRDARKGLLKPLPVPDRFFQDLSIDFITDLPAERRGDNRYIMVITDRLLKSVVLEAMPNMEARKCAERFMQAWWRHHGFPRTLTSDRGGNWVSDFWAELCQLVGTERRLTTAYNPRSDGQVERWNQEIQAILRGVVNYAQTDWPSFLPGTMFAINNRQSSTHGMSPFYITHGYHPDPIQLVEPEHPSKGGAAAMVERWNEAQEVAQAAMGWAQEQMEAQANRTRRPAEQFRVGDRVWLDLRNIKSPRTSKKLSWTHAKFTVTAVPFPHVVELNVPTGIHPRFHVELVRRAASNPLPSQQLDDSQPGPLLEASMDEEEEWEIERVMRVEKTAWRGTELPWALVKWVGYVEPTWEPLDEVQHSDAFGRFREKYGTGWNVGEDGSAPLGKKLRRGNGLSAAYARRLREPPPDEGGGNVMGVALG